MIVIVTLEPRIHAYRVVYVPVIFAD